MIGRLASGLTAGSLILGTVLTSGPGSLRLVSADQVYSDGSNDFDGDDHPDVLIGAPDADGGRGVVEVRLASGASVRLTRASVPGQPRVAADRFGASLLVSRFDDDAYLDLAVGAPGVGGHGDVFVLFGGPAGFRTDRVAVIASKRAGDWFGSALAHGLQPSTFARGFWVGIPGRTVNAHPRAGAIALFTFTSGVTFRWQRTISQDSANVPGIADAGDRFGGVLHDEAGVTKNDLVIVGVPHEDVGTARDAGMVETITSTGGRALTENTRGIPGTAQSGDQFGAALANTGSWAIGVPGKTVNGHAGAGELLVQQGRTWNRVVEGATFTGFGYTVPGRPQAGARFGAAVAQQLQQDKAYDVDTVVGAPGQSIAGEAAAGSVTVLPNATGYSPSRLYRGHGLPGTPTAGDRVGTTVFVLNYLVQPGDFQENVRESAMYGAPGVDLNGVSNVGAVFAPSFPLQTTFYPSVLTAGTRYGSTMENAS